jgi:putative nucleotidyltransferase with HDIG domain
MSDAGLRRGRLWPRSGIMSSDAGRRVVLGAFALTGACFGAAALVLAAAVFVSVRLGWLAGDVARPLVLGVAACVAAATVAFALLPVLARFSRVGDDVRLLEMCDPGSPLLRELMENADGTYNHSIMTGALAETAARSIGANALLARVGAYYHDIGKLVRPQFFAENQSGRRNPHDGAAPAQSAFIITAHVREGVALAEQAGLPRPVIDIIAEHHGTSLVTYFYRKATAGGASVDEAPFRYEGVLPRSREAALVMLADAAEASVRGLSEAGALQIESAVRRVVDTKTADGQLASSGMSDDDVEAAVVTYAKMLAGLRHSRVEYPDDAEGDRDAGHSQLEP